MSNARNLANLLSPSTAKLTRDSILDADGYSRLLMDASDTDTDVGDNFLLNGTDVSSSNDGSKIVFEAATDDASELLSKTTTNLPALNFISSPTISLASNQNTIDNMVHLVSHTHTGAVASVSFSGDQIQVGNFDAYFIMGRFTPSTDGVNMMMRFSGDGGRNYSSANDYNYEAEAMSSSVYVNSNDGNAILFNASTIGNSTGENCAFRFHLYNNNNSFYPVAVSGACSWFTTSGLHSGGGFSGGYDIANRDKIVNGLQFLFSSGNAENAELQIYGMLPQTIPALGNVNG